MAALLDEYNSRTVQDLDDLLEFHHRFEVIHPFQDGNGLIGRLILFKECLKHRIVPFIITEELKRFYYRGLATWKAERGYLRDTALRVRRGWSTFGFLTDCQTPATPLLRELGQ